MAGEIEIKVLNVDAKKVGQVLTELWANCTPRRLLSVDWFRQPIWDQSDDQWYLRIRKYGDGPSEVTWKSKTISTEFSRIHKKEINFTEAEPEKLADLFSEIGLDNYAHQDKYRTSWNYQDWHFDLDEYPGMPPYLEIEWKDDDHIRQALSLLWLEGNETTSIWERILITNTYWLDWFHMHF